MQVQCVLILCYIAALVVTQRRVWVNNTCRDVTVDMYQVLRENLGKVVNFVDVIVARTMQWSTVAALCTNRWGQV